MKCKVVGFINPDIICERYQKEIVHKIESTWLSEREADDFYKAMTEVAWDMNKIKLLLTAVESRIKNNRDFAMERNNQRKESH
jgi:hypothetical protein